MSEDAFANPVDRRVVTKGAAWAVPIIAAAVTAPVSSASNQIVLTFNQPVYAIDRCSFEEMSVTATVNGAPAPDGTVVTVTLPPELQFEDGSQTFTGPTTGGLVTLPYVLVTPNGDSNVVPFSSAITAASGSATTTSTVTGEIGAGEVSYTVNNDSVENNAKTLTISNSTCDTTAGLEITYNQFPAPYNRYGFGFSYPDSNGNPVTPNQYIRRVNGQPLAAVSLPGLSAGETRTVTITPYPGTDGVSFDGSSDDAEFERWLAVTLLAYTGDPAQILPHDNWTLSFFGDAQGTNPGAPGIPGM